MAASSILLLRADDCLQRFHTARVNGGHGVEALVGEAEAHPDSPNLEAYIQIADRCMRLQRDIGLLTRDLLASQQRGLKLHAGPENRSRLVRRSSQSEGGRRNPPSKKKSGGLRCANPPYAPTRYFSTRVIGGPREAVRLPHVARTVK